MHVIPSGAVVAVLAAWFLVPAAVAVAQGADATINMNQTSFDKAEVHVAPGQIVLWSNPNGPAHTVTADDGSFNSGDVTPGASFSMEFDTPGSYPFYCEYHGDVGGVGMSGVIVVDV